jgi:hypothetical protein
MKLILIIIMQITIILPYIAYSSYINIEYPVGGEILNSSTTCKIQWTSSDELQGGVEILIWDADSCTFNTIATGVPIENGHFYWNIPYNYSGNKFRIKVAYYSSTFTYDLTDTYITICPEEQQYSTKSDEIIEVFDNFAYIYPNPARDYFHIFITEKIGIKELRLYDNSGNFVKNIKFDVDNYKIPCSLLPCGVYYLKFILDNNKIVTKKIIICE